MQQDVSSCETDRLAESIAAEDGFKWPIGRLERRQFLRVGSAGALGLLITAAFPEGMGLAFANDDDGKHDRSAISRLEKQLRTIGQSADAQAVNQALAVQLSKVAPAAIILAQQTLHDQAANLSGFQKSALQAVPIALRHPDALAAKLTGSPLTHKQKEQLDDDQDALDRNPAIRRLIQFTKPLREKKNRTTLAADVQQEAGALQELSAGQVVGFVPSGNANFDAVMQGLLSIMATPAAGSLGKAVLPIWQDPAFVSLLQELDADKILTLFVPSSQAVSLLLKNDHDPGLSPIAIAGIGIGIALACFVGAFLSLSAVPAAAIIGLIVAEIALIGGLILIWDQLLKALDCDSDGDPGDPNESSECIPSGSSAVRATSPQRLAPAH